MAFVADACSFVDLIRSDASSGEIKLSASVSYMSKSQTYPATLDVKTHGELNLPIKMLDTTVNFKVFDFNYYIERIFEYFFKFFSFFFRDQLLVRNF